MEEPIITPARFLGHAALPAELAGCQTAVLGFCRFYNMRDKLAAKPLPERWFSHVDEIHQFSAQAKGVPIVAVDCLYGGPHAATVVEELAHFRVKRALGYGFAGSLTRDLPVGSVLLATSGLVSDGASREYVPGQREVYPDPVLLELLRKHLREQGVVACEGTVWTTDAIYREYPEKVGQWRQAGALAVNMDTSHFYAVSQVVGLEAVYACAISDCVDGPRWEDGFGRIREAVGCLQDAIVAVAAELG
jgi:uridine phosphorylase